MSLKLNIYSCSNRKSDVVHLKLCVAESITGGQQRYWRQDRERGDVEKVSMHLLHSNPQMHLLSSCLRLHNTPPSLPKT